MELTWLTRSRNYSHSTKSKKKNKRKRNHFRDTEVKVTGLWSDNWLFYKITRL